MPKVLVDNAAHCAIGWTNICPTFEKFYARFNFYHVETEFRLKGLQTSFDSLKEATMVS